MKTQVVGRRIIVFLFCFIPAVDWRYCGVAESDFWVRFAWIVTSCCGVLVVNSGTSHLKVSPPARTIAVGICGRRPTTRASAQSRSINLHFERTIQKKNLLRLSSSACFWVVVILWNYDFLGPGRIAAIVTWLELRCVEVLFCST